MKVIEDSLNSGVTAPEIALSVQGLRVVYGANEHRLVALDDISFEVRAGELLCIVGPSGCGKTTLLRSIAGLMSPTSGEVLAQGKRVTSPLPDLALVFQEYARTLMPWLTVEKNVTFPLQNRGHSRAAIRERAHAALSAVGLEGFERSYPWQLSGGMQQRVAIARAIAFQPKVLLMDEPFASVDAQVRAELEDLVLRVHRDLGITTLFVTHDIDESVYLGDRVLVLSKRPTTVLTTVPVNLPGDRDQLTTRAEPEFVRLRSEVMSLIRAEKSVDPTHQK